MKRALSRKNLWESLPAPAKRLAGTALRAIPLAWLLGRRFRQTLRQLADVETWAPEQIRAYQVDQLRRVCTAALRSPFYREHFAAAGFDPADLRRPEDLRVLPCIDRDTVRTHLRAMCTVDPRRANVDLVSTGGSSGQPLQLYMPADRSGFEYAHLVMSWRRAGFVLGSTLAVFRGHAVQPDRSGLPHVYDPLLREHRYSSFQMTPEMMARYLEHIRRIGPCFLHVYPSSVYVLARFIRDSGRSAPENIRGIIAESEIVYPQQRQFVEKVFGVRYFSCYGHSEKAVCAAECEHTTDAHVWPSYGYFELLDDAGRPVTTPGERGEIVATSFVNTVMPLIRYRTGDFATWVGERCARCGRWHPVIRDIRGHRTQEMLVTRDGALVSWTAINMHDDTFDRVVRFQFLQTRPGRATLRIVRGPGFGEADAARIRHRLHQKLGDGLQIELEYVDRIDLTQRGKTTYVDQRIAGIERHFEAPVAEGSLS